MPLKKSQGNMYDWVTHMHTHIGGECPHECKYCYVGKNRFGRAKRYTGELRIMREELRVNYGKGKIIFIEHMNDLFAYGVPGTWIADILAHCREYPGNDYVFQTKNPQRALNFEGRFPVNHIIGTTIETNRVVMGNAPKSEDRYKGIRDIGHLGARTFITIEPIMDFDVEVLSDWIITTQPVFVNIGADSKRCGLPEPSGAKILELVSRLQGAGVAIRKKINLERILSA